MRPLFSYYGGKQRMASKIVPLLPRHTVYVEPFAGGAAVMFAKPWPPATNNNEYREVLNDINRDIVNLYRVACDRERGPELVQRLIGTPYARFAYEQARHLDASASNVERAWAYYVSIRMSFANILHGGWGTSVYKQNCAASWLQAVDRLPECLERLYSVHIECDEALAVIKRWDSPQTLFYCDPPYPEAHQHHYDGYGQDDFVALVSALRTCEGSVVLSCYENDAVPADWERFEFQANCHASGQGQTGPNRDKTRAATAEEQGDRRRTEVVWRVDRSDVARDEIQRVWRRWGWRKGMPMPGAKTPAAVVEAKQKANGEVRLADILATLAS